MHPLVNRQIHFTG